MALPGVKLAALPPTRGRTAPSVVDARLRDQLAAVESRGLRRRLRAVDRVGDGVSLTVDGRQAVGFCGNSYLDLSTNPQVVAAASETLQRQGLGAGSSRMISGHLPAHRELEEELRCFHAVEAVLLFSSGYHANLGVLGGLLGPEDFVVSDALNHASIIDGCRLTRARIAIYRHADSAHAAELLASEPARLARRRMLCSEALYSMDGDIAPLAGLREVADRGRALLMVDEAHSGFALGPGGRGLCAAQGVQPDVHVGTLGKALGAIGAYVAGSAALRETMINRARTFIYTTAPPPAICAGAAVAVRIAASAGGEMLRARLRDNAARLAGGLHRLGIGDPLAAAHIQPVRIGNDARTMEVCDRLLAAGYFAQGIRPPTVPPGTSRLRLTVSAGHRRQQVDGLLCALGELGIGPCIHRSQPDV